MYPGVMSTDGVEIEHLRKALNEALEADDDGSRPSEAYPPGTELPTAAANALARIADEDLASSFRKAVGIE